MPEFTLEQGLKARALLRAKGNMPTESFDEKQLIGMISDEIRELRTIGVSDEEIARTLQQDAGLPLDSSAISEHYVDTSQYGHP